MKMEKKKFELMTLVLATLLIFSYVTRTQAQEYEYQSSLLPDVTYEWQITTLVTTGYDNLPYLAFGDDILEQGDKISVKILANVSAITNGDPSQLFNTSNVWIEFYLNGENKTTNINDIGVIDLAWTGWVGYFFLMPTTYTNETGTYNNFEVINEGFQQINGEDKTETKEHGYYEYVYSSIKQSSKLSKKTWTIKLNYHSEYKENDFTDPEDWSKVDTTIDNDIEIRYNVETGLIVYLNHEYSWHSINEVEGSLDDDTRSISLLLESTQLPTAAPFNWIFALLGIGTWVLTIRKKRKNL